MSEENCASNPLGKEHYNQIEACLGYEFKDKDVLERALTHRSMPTANDLEDYERYEFLGDAVIDLAVADLLLKEHPKAKEGDLSKMRAALVNTASLASVANEINLSPYIRLSRGELAQGGATKPSIMADVFEAVIGALYKEAGFDIAKNSIVKVYGDRISDVKPRDPKTELQETLHIKNLEAPEYILESIEGPEHAPTFISLVKVKDKVYGRGSGTSKKSSQQNAAEEALKVLNSD